MQCLAVLVEFAWKACGYLMWITRLPGQFDKSFMFSLVIYMDAHLYMKLQGKTAQFM